MVTEHSLKNWQTQKLGELCEKITKGSSPNWQGIRYVDKPGVLFITSENVGENKIILGKRKYVEERFNISDKKSILQNGDVLTNIVGASIGRTAVFTLNEIANINQAVCILRCNSGILYNLYLMHLLNSPFFKKILHDNEVDNARANLSLGFFSNLLIPVPPLPEQQRIVAILDDAFAAIATAKENAEKNLQNARELFESHLHTVFTKRGEGWVDRTLDQVCIVERGSSPRPIKDYFTTESNGVNWIKIGDTEEGEKYLYSTAQKITPEGAKQSRFVKEGDFILTNSMSFGRPYIMKTSGYIHDGWFVLRLNISIDTDYFYYLLSSRFVQSQFAQLASGSVVKNISGDLVKKAVLPIPPLTHQHVIVEKLLEISAETKKLEALYRKKLADLDELKKSVLQKAFSGDL